MSGLVTSLFLVFLLPSVRSTAILGDDEESYFKDCPPTSCSTGGPEVRFPLRLKSSPTYCGVRGIDLSCSGNQTILTLPSSGPYTVAAIDYRYGIITTNPFGSPRPCPLQNLSSASPTNSVENVFEFWGFSLVSCSERFTPNDYDSVAGPISCLGGADQFVYVAYSSESMDILPSDCIVISTGGGIPDNYGGDLKYLDSSFRDSVEAFSQGRELSLHWYSPAIGYQCSACEAAGQLCGFNRLTNQTFCYSFGHHGSQLKLIIGTSIGGLVILVLAALILLYISRKSEKEKETRLKVKRFLAMHRTTNPTRYSYASIKKITKQFKQKLGQGGFGSVYKGELPNGIPVAVKLLEKSRGEGEEFINEVATIGRIHHVNIVRLLGFCSEGTRHALVYEFMPNESLEKFIFWKESKRIYRPLSMEKLQEIALGIAQGIEYLHQGCNQRILHFDIKPHNILLDHDFNPKISDFGLAKLCSRDQSIITMTAARGTLGYMAPEIYSRNFGTVSYKSDVYSFGMLVMEIVCGRKNIDPAIENQGDVYFPEWVYDRLVHGQDLELVTDLEGKEEEITKKLAIVALWCIQWSPMDRPSMTKVVQMLMGNLQSLQMPPKPFVSSSDQDNAADFPQVQRVDIQIL